MSSEEVKTEGQQKQLPPEVEKNIAAQSQPSSVPSQRRREAEVRTQRDSDLVKAFSYVLPTPAIQAIQLPSRGVLYDGNLPGGNLEVTALTAREEKLLAGATGDVTAVIDTIFERCVKSMQMHPGDFLSSDRFYTLLMLRANSYGPEYSFGVTCEACSFEFDKMINIPDDFELVTLDDNASEPFTVTLPRSGKKIGFHLPRGREEVQITRYQERELGGSKKRRRVAKQEGDPAYSYRLALLIDTLDGYDVSERGLMHKKIEYVEQLIGADSVALQNAIKDHDCGVETEMEERCPKCNKLNRFMMPFTADFFVLPLEGAESILKQQFQLAYYARVAYADTENMPSYERNFLYEQLAETKKQEEEEMNKSSKGKSYRRS